MHGSALAIASYKWNILGVRALNDLLLLELAVKVEVEVFEAKSGSQSSNSS